MTSTEERLRETIRHLLTYTGERQEDLALALDMRQPQLSKRLKAGGDSCWRLADLDALSLHYGLTPSELLMGYGWLETQKRLPEAVRRRVAARAAGQDTLLDSPPLTPTQQRFMDHLAEHGTVSDADPFGLATARALHKKGLVKLSVWAAVWSKDGRGQGWSAKRPA